MVSESAQPAEVCLINIGPNERKKRVVFGVVGTALGIGLALGLAASSAGRLLRLVTAVPFFVGALGFYQARAKT